MPRQRTTLLGGGVQRELEGLDRPAFRNFKASHHGQSSSPSSHSGHSPSLQASHSPTESRLNTNPVPQQKHENTSPGVPIRIPTDIPVFIQHTTDNYRPLGPQQLAALN